MSEDKPRKPAALDRPRRLRAPRLRRSWKWAVLIADLCAIAVGLYVLLPVGGDARERGPGQDDCASAVLDGRWPIAVSECRREYENRGDPKAGARLADALFRTGDRAEARRVALALRTTSAQADGLYVLGRIARKEDRIEEAISLQEGARTLHQAANDGSGVARDSGELASIRVHRSEFGEALKAAHVCLREAKLTRNSPLTHYCSLIAAQAFTRVGHFEAAREMLGTLDTMTTSAVGRRDNAYQRANLAQESALESGRHEEAIVWYEQALKLNQDLPSPDNSWALNTELNIAYSSAEIRDFDKAREYLLRARKRNYDHSHDADWAWTAARVAYRQGGQAELAKASALTNRYIELRRAEAGKTAENAGFDRDEWIDVTTLRARIELEQGNVADAELWAHRAVDEVERIRGGESTLELRPWVLTKRRAPYELWFTALARGGDVAGAAMAFDKWQGRTVRDALAAPATPEPLDRARIEERLSRLALQQPSVSKATFARSADQKAVLATMQRIDLLALIVANDQVWRLTAQHGPPQLERIGPWSDVESLIDDFLEAPRSTQPATALGTRLLPDSVFGAGDVLYVVLDGQFGTLPIAALRRGGSPLISIRPIVRLLRLPETGCRHTVRSGAAALLTYPDVGRDKLANATKEIEEVARLLPMASETNVAASRAALFAAADSAVLHIVAHASIGIDGAALKLNDGHVSALEIIHHRVAPSLAVLSACGSAASASNDKELAGSLATAFLGAGSQYVVATLQAVSDTGALPVISRFYRAGGATDPVRALATAQSQLSKTNNPDWPYFAVFSSDVCAENDNHSIN